MTNIVTNLCYIVNPVSSVLETDWHRMSYYFVEGFCWGFYVLAGWWVAYTITRALRAPRWPSGDNS